MVSNNLPIDPFNLPNKNTTELINTLVYNNYGVIPNSRAVDLSKANNLALATDKCLCIINYNFDWPSSLNHSSANKYFQKSPPATKDSKSRSKPQSIVYVDSWIQDLHESKNESFFVNVIRSVPKSRMFIDLNKQFFSLDELNIKIKRKSFPNQIKDIMNNSIRSQDKKSNNSNAIDRIIDPNDEQLFIHRLLFTQTQFFDSFLHDYLAYLNPTSYHNTQVNSQTSEQQQQKPTFDGYRFCAWNSNLRRNLLFTITECNQMILFDLTKLISSSNNNINLKSLNDIESIFEDQELMQIDESQRATHRRNRSYLKNSTKKFDFKTQSKLVNMTEYWLRRYRPECLKNSSLQQFKDHMSRVIPLSAFWSRNGFEMNLSAGSVIEFELLFIAFKSNEIGAFLVFIEDHTPEISSENGGNGFVPFDDSELCIELYQCVEVDWQRDTESDEENEYVHTELGPSPKPVISAISFYGCRFDSIKLTQSGHGILAVGMSDGHVLMRRVEIAQPKIKDLLEPHAHNNEKVITSDEILSEWFPLENTGFSGSVEKLEIVILDNVSDNYMIIIQYENRIVFDLFTLSQRFVLQDKYCFRITEETNFLGQTRDRCRNFLTKNHFKLIEFKIMNKSELSTESFEFDLFLTYDNSYIEHLNLRVNVKEIRFIRESVLTFINSSSEIKFDLVKTTNENNPLTSNNNSFLSALGGNMAFKTARQIAFSTNQYLLYQIFDYSKSHLVHKKPPNFTINIYKIKSTVSTPASIACLPHFFSHSMWNRLALFKSNDIMWLFKREFYLNNEAFFNWHLFNSFYEHLKQTRTFDLLDDDIDTNLTHFKKIRILVYFALGYYQKTALFNKSNMEIQALTAAECKEEGDMEDLENEDEPDEEPVSNDEGLTLNSDYYSINSTYNQEAAASGLIIIREVEFYKTHFKELTINIFKYYVIELLITAYRLGFENLTPREKLLTAVQGEFAIKKNFFASLNLSALNSKYSLELENLETIEKWLRDDICSKMAVKTEHMDDDQKVNEKRSNLASMIEAITCDLCGENFDFKNSLEIQDMKCVHGHVMNRCQKTLLPLDNYRHEKCPLCHSAWNYVTRDCYPNFLKLIQNLKLCLYCD